MIKDLLDTQLALIILSPALIVPLAVNRFPYKLAPNVPNNIIGNPLLCSLTSFWIVSLTPINDKLEYSIGLTILIMSSILSFDIINVVVSDPKIFLCIPASAAADAAVNPNGIKTFLAHWFNYIFINGNPVFNIGTRNLPRNPPRCIILDNWVCGSLILSGELFAKTLWRFETYLLVNQFRRKISFIIRVTNQFDDNLVTTSVSFFIADFNLLSREFDSFTLKLL